jgi:exopolysaccharide production protein ExoZ
MLLSAPQQPNKNCNRGMLQSMPMIKFIQYLRGLAAMLVVWHHAQGQIGSWRFIGASTFGSYGVDLFFVISGFIMLVTTWDKPIGPAEFIRHRIRRVVPLYWLTTLLMVALALIAPALFKTLKFDAASLAKSLFFIPYYSLSFPDLIRPLLVPGWSLNYEMFFYAIFAATLLLRREMRLPAVLAVLIALVALGLAIHPQSAPAFVYTDPIILEFAAGMILGRLWVMWPHPHANKGLALPLALGNASYSIYLSHLFTLGALRLAWMRLIHVEGLMPSIAFMATALIASALVGWLCFVAVERPLTRWFKSDKRRPVKMRKMQRA